MIHMFRISEFTLNNLGGYQISENIIYDSRGTSFCPNCRQALDKITEQENRDAWANYGYAGGCEAISKRCSCGTRYKIKTVCSPTSWGQDTLAYVF